MRVKSIKMTGRVKRPQYIGIGPIKPRNIPATIGRAKRPPRLRGMMLETAIRRGLGIVKLVYKAVKKPKKITTKKYIIKEYYTPEAVRKGPFGLIEVEFSEKGKKILELLKQTDIYNYMMILSFSIMMLRLLHKHINIEFTKHYKKIAQDTNALREDLFISISERRSILPSPAILSIDNAVLRMRFGSYLPYADYISTGRHKKTGRYIRLKHHGIGDTRSRRTGKWLYDPLAERNILNYHKSTILIALRKVMRKLLKTMISYTASRLKISYAQAKKMYIIKHIKGRI